MSWWILSITRIIDYLTVNQPCTPRWYSDVNIEEESFIFLLFTLKAALQTPHCSHMTTFDTFRALLSQLHTFILLSGAICTTIANLHTLRWSMPDFKCSSHCRPCGRTEMPIKQRFVRAGPRCLPLTVLWRAANPMGFETIACFQPACSFSQHFHLRLSVALKFLLFTSALIMLLL